jgi:hypothetical protein
MHLRLLDQVNLSDFVEINLAVTQSLEVCEPYGILIIDINQTKNLPTAIEQIRSSQHYARDPRLKWLLIVGTNKLVRLTLLVVFHLSWANIQFFNNDAEAQTFLYQMQLMSGGKSYRHTR